jgi:hypothetical protein
VVLDIAYGLAIEGTASQEEVIGYMKFIKTLEMCSVILRQLTPDQFCLQGQE